MRYTNYDELKKRWQINDDYGAVMIDELNYAVGEAIDKLAAYEEAEEQGLLVRLPCKVGTKAYKITRFCYGGASDCSSIISCEYCDDYRLEIVEYRIDTVIRAVAAIESLGQTVFLSREEAEAALKGETEDV